MFKQRNHIFLNLTQLRRYGDLAVTTFDLTESYLSVDLRYDSRVRRVTSLEQLGYTRKTTGENTGLTYGPRAPPPPPPRKLSNSILPETSDTITALNGSHSMITSPFLIESPLLKNNLEP